MGNFMPIEQLQLDRVTPGSESERESVCLDVHCAHGVMPPVDRCHGHALERTSARMACSDSARHVSSAHILGGTGACARHHGYSGDKRQREQQTGPSSVLHCPIVSLTWRSFSLIGRGARSTEKTTGAIVAGSPMPEVPASPLVQRSTRTTASGAPVTKAVV